MKKRLKDFSLFLKRWLPVVLWAGLVLYASTSVGSGDNTGRILRTLLSWLRPDLAYAPLVEINFYIRKTAHVIQFVIYAILIWRGLGMAPPLVTRRRWILVWVLGSAALLAFLSEGIQLFTAVRTPSFGDVRLDFSGALIGAFLMLAAGAWRKGRNRSVAPPSPSVAPPASGTILITSDLYLDTAPDQGREIFQALQSAFRESNADALLVAGDFGAADRAHKWMGDLRAAVGPRALLVICLGDRDHWLREEDPSCSSPNDVREKYWRPACEAHGIRCLDFENVELPGITLCGGYGHYDFGFKDPDLMADGQHPSSSDYTKGQFGGMLYPDQEKIPGLSLGEEAGWQTRAISRRLTSAADRGQQVLFATHTVPFAALNVQTAPRGSLPRFFDAYAGNSSIGSLISAMAPDIAAAVCGHTHKASPIVTIHGIPCINTGSGPEHLRFLLFQMANRSIFRWNPQEKTTVA